MAKRIVTKNKKDIDTGFEIAADFDFYKILTSVIGGRMSLPTETFHELAKQSVAQVEPQVKNLIDQAEQIFIEEASLSRWSGNMIDNSVCGISGTMDYLQESISIDIMVGVNRKEIMNTANWTSRANKRPMGRNASSVIYEYNGFRMRPGIDYSKFLEEGTARIPNAAAWAGFVERAEERFNAL